MKKLLIFAVFLFALPVAAQVNINAASGGNVEIGSPVSGSEGCATSNLIANGCTGGTTAQGAVASLGATGWLSGAGAPTATCSSSTNNGYFYTSNTLALYQCSAITGPYLWNVLAPAGVVSVNGLTGVLNIVGGTGIAVGTSSPNITVNVSPGTSCNPAGQFAYGIDASANALCSPLPSQPSSQYIAPQAVAGCGVQWVSGLSYTVGACTYTINGVTYNSPLSTITLPAADPSNPEIDAIYVGTAQTVQYLQGTAAPDPLQPTVNPATQLALTFVLVPAGATTPANTTQVEIYLDDDDQWTPSVGGTSSANVNFNSTNNPFQGTQDTEFGTAGTVAQTTYVQYTDPSSGTVMLNNYNSLVFYLRNKAAWPATGSVTIQWYNGSTAVGSGIVISSGAFGFNSTTNTTTYQQIWIPTATFGAGSNPVTSVRFTVSGTGAALAGFYLDYVTLQGGIGGPILPATLMNWQGTWTATQAYNPNDVVASGGIGYVALLANTNQLVTNATYWAPLATSGGGTYTPGTGISIASNVITNLGNTDINAVTDLGMDPTGSIDGSSILQTELNSASNLSIYFPCGQYKLNSGILVSATSATAENLKLYAASPGCVRFNSTYAGDILWFDNTSSAADNNFGPTLDGIIFNDTSGTGAVHSCVRLTEYAYFFWNNLRCTNATGKQYQTGTVSVSNGSNAVTGVGTIFTTAMIGGRFWINGKMQEVASVGSGTSLTLVDPWQYPTASGASYSLDYNGVGLLFDGGTSYTQYGVVANYYGLTDAVGVQALGSSAGGIGVSRIHFFGGEINSSRIPDSIGYMLGDTSDSFETNSPINNVAIGWALENTHANKIAGADLENEGAYTVVSTCNGGVASQACTAGLVAIGQSSSNARNNTIEDTYIYHTGTAVSWDQYNYYFTAVGNRILPSVNTTVFAPPATVSTGYTTANVFDYSLDLVPSLIISGQAATSGENCLQIDSSGNVTKTGSVCGSGSSGFPITIGSTSIASGSTTTSLAGLTVNGVTLSSSGSAGLFLTQAGTYVAPSGSGIVSNCTTAGALAYYAATGTTITCDANALTDGSGGLTAKTITLDGSTNFYVNMTTAGSLPSAPGANTIQMTVPNSVTAYAFELPGAQPTSGNTFLSCTAANPSICSWAAGGGGTPGGSNTQLQVNNTGSFGGTAGITYTGTAGNLNLASTDPFTGTGHYAQYLVSNTNGCNINSELALQVGSAEVAGMVGCVNATSVGASVEEADGVLGISVGSFNFGSPPGANVGGRFLARSTAGAASQLWGVVSSVLSISGSATTMQGEEIDVNAINTGDNVQGLTVQGAWSAVPILSYGSVVDEPIAGTGGPYHWQKAFLSNAGAALVGFESGPLLASGTSIAGQPTEYDYFDSSGTLRQDSVAADNAGYLTLTGFAGIKLPNLTSGCLSLDGSGIGGIVTCGTAVATGNNTFTGQNTFLPSAITNTPITVKGTTGSPALTLVHSVSNSGSSAAFGATTAGDSIVVFEFNSGGDPGGAGSVTLASSGSNTYTLVNTTRWASNLTMFVWVATNISGGAETITESGGFGPWVAAYEYAGTVVSKTVDQANQNFGSSAPNPTLSGSITTAHNDLIYTFFSASPITTWSSATAAGFTSLLAPTNIAGLGIGISYQTGGAATYQGSWTNGTGADYLVGILALELVGTAQSADLIDYDNAGGTVLSGISALGLPYTVSQNFSGLPTCSSGTEGTTVAVKDSTTNTWGATITGSGSDHVQAYCDGTNWTVAAK